MNVFAELVLFKMFEKYLSYLSSLGMIERCAQVKAALSVQKNVSESFHPDFPPHIAGCSIHRPCQVVMIPLF